jgi:hypothetical protein
MEGTLIEDTLIEDTLKEDTLKEDTLILECYQALYLEGTNQGYSYSLVTSKEGIDQVYTQGPAMAPPQAHTQSLDTKAGTTKSTIKAWLFLRMAHTSTHSKLGHQGGCNQVYS